MLNNPTPRVDFVPADHGLVSWTYDPACIVTAQATPAAGTLYVVMLKIPQPTLVTAIVMMNTIAGSTLTAGQNFAALYDASGNQVGVTADQTTAWAAAAGTKDMPLTAPVTVSGPFCRVGFYANGSVLPSWRCGVGAAPGNVNIGAGAARSGVANTGLTTTPPATLGSISIGFPWWVGLR